MHLRIPITVFICSALIVPIIASANAHTVTPRIIDREVSQRDIFSETVTITNNKSHKIRVYPTVNAISVDSGGDITSFTPPSVSDNKVTPTSWVEITRARQEIEPGKSITIPVNFKIHPEAEPGVYHVLLGFGSGSNRPTAEEQVKNGQAPSVIVTLKVDQDRSEFLKLSGFIIDRFVTSPENSAVTYTLSNPGDIDVVPSGEIIFYNGRGEEVAAVPVNPDNDSLTPGQETTYSTAAPIEGLLGKYKAFLSVDYGSAQLASVYDTAFFYVLPWQKLLMIFVIVMAIAIVLTIVLHRKLGGEVYDEDADHVPMFVRETVSEEKDHDINLKQ